MSDTPISPLRRRMIEDMSLRKFGEKTQNDHIGHVKTFSTFLGRSPATATPEDLRRYQVQQSQSGVSPATINSSVSALRFFFQGDAQPSRDGPPPDPRAPARARGDGQQWITPGEQPRARLRHPPVVAQDRQQTWRASRGGPSCPCPARCVAACVACRCPRA